MGELRSVSGLFSRVKLAGVGERSTAFPREWSSLDTICAVRIRQAEVVI